MPRAYPITVLLSIYACLLVQTAAADGLEWKALSEQTYSSAVTVTESVATLQSLTVKPTLTTRETGTLATAAENMSTRAHLRGIMSFPKGSVEPGDTWKGTVTVIYELSAFGVSLPLRVSAPAEFTYKGISGEHYGEITARWHPLFELSRIDSRKSGILRISGFSTMTLLWDMEAGGPVQTHIIEEVQYRFTDGTALVHRRETKEEISLPALVQEQGAL